MDELVKAFLQYGLVPVSLVVFIFLLVQDPNRAEKLKALILKPLFRFRKWFSKGYISAEVSSNVNQFLSSSVFPYTLSNEKYKIKIDWVTNTQDSVFKKNGNLILRLKQDVDQTKNILNATQAAIPNIVIPLIRSNIDYSTEKSIDLTLLKLLSEKIGRHGQYIFTKFFLKPETQEDQNLATKIEKLVNLDYHGFFLPIFLNELEMVGEEIFAKSDITDYSSKVNHFIDYLITIANREIGSEIQLEYINPPIKVGTLLLAKAQRATTEGVRPYLRRIRINLEKGCNSIYVIAFSPAFDFFEILLKSLDSYERVNIEKVIQTKDFAMSGKKIKQEYRIIVLSKNLIFSDESFQEKVHLNNIKVGNKINGIAEQVSTKEAQISIQGLRAYIRKEDLDWFSNGNCNNKLIQDQEYDFYVKKIDFSSCTIFLTLNDPNNNPWKKIRVPDLKEIIEVVPLTLNGNSLLCSYLDSVEVRIPFDQISWFNKPSTEFIHLIGSKVEVKVLSSNANEELIIASIKMMEDNPWESIHKAIPQGTFLNGKVVEINNHFVKVDLNNNMIGTIPSFCLKRAGHEYANYTENMVLGQGIDVIVTKVFVGKRKITLDLRRNDTNFKKCDDIN